MAIKRRFPRKARPSRKRVRVAARRAPARRRMRIPVSINRRPIAYSREIPFNNILIPTGGNKVFFAQTFAANLLPNLTDFTGLFDQYRIRAVTCKFRLIQPPEATNTPATSQFYPDIYLAVDHDDAAVPTAVDDVL